MHNPASLIRVLGGALAAGGFLYFTFCFAFMYAFSRNLDLDLLLFLSFEDYLKPPIILNVFLVLLFALVILVYLTWNHTISKIFPNHLADFYTQWLIHVPWVINLLACLIVTFVLVSLVWELRIKDATAGALPLDISPWLFWSTAAAALLFGVLSLPERWIGPAALFIIFMGINLGLGYLHADGVQRRPANIVIHPLDLTEKPITGTFVVLSAKGVIYLPSDPCNPPAGKRIHVVGWSAVRLIGAVPADARDCRPSDGKPPFP